MDINARNVRENRQILQFSGYSYQDLKNDLHIYSRIFEKIVCWRLEYIRLEKKKS